MSRPAIADTSACSISLIGSGSPSLVGQAGTVCGSPPVRWTENIEYWDRTGFSPDSNVTALFPSLSNPYAVDPSATCLQALNGTGAVTFTFTASDSNGTKTATGSVSGLLAELVAAALNAEFFGSNYPRSRADIDQALASAYNNSMNSPSFAVLPPEDRVNKQVQQTTTTLTQFLTDLSADNRRGS